MVTPKSNQVAAVFAKGDAESIEAAKRSIADNMGKPIERLGKR
jgi:hypothetical protein